MLKARSVVGAFSIFLSSLLAEEPVGRPVLIEGTWSERGVRNIIGAGTETTVIVKKNEIGWTITYEIVRYPSVNDKGAVPVIRTEGPYKVTVDDQELVIAKEDKEVRYTFLCDPQRMILPAIVQKRPGEWAFRSESESFVVRCENDPLKVPMGKAEIPGVLGGRGFYSYEEAPRSRLSTRGQYLRFLDRSDEKGQLFERFRLIFDQYGSPRYEAILETGERSDNARRLRFFFASDKAK
jgi:hypothetical protein